MNPPRTLLAALKAHPMKGVQWFAKFHPELLELYFKHGEAMVAALRELLETTRTYDYSLPRTTDVKPNLIAARNGARAVLAALDGKDAT